jgi:hypothetical protein
MEMKKLMIPILILLMVSIPVAIAEEDEDDDEERKGFGIMEREREHQDDEELAIGSDTGNMILYGTIAAIIVSVGYTGFKLYRTKKSKVSKP